ncbi:hypothetical protein HC891_17590 [Candidatus Gracilibacteria bacterium]|nr:hypothetical protein [Candidatus Gracilibacteria bacterium]
MSNKCFGTITLMTAIGASVLFLLLLAILGWAGASSALLFHAVSVLAIGWIVFLLGVVPCYLLRRYRAGWGRSQYSEFRIQKFRRQYAACCVAAVLAATSSQLRPRCHLPHCPRSCLPTIICPPSRKDAASPSAIPS